VRVNALVARGHFPPSGGVALDRQLLQAAAGAALQGRSDPERTSLESLSASRKTLLAATARAKGKTQDESKIDTRVI
jgi:hypothetical protein